jgi:hypothetical protein
MCWTNCFIASSTSFFPWGEDDGENRTLQLAEERTSLAHIRTGFASFIFGIGLLGLFKTVTSCTLLTSSSGLASSYRNQPALLSQEQKACQKKIRSWRQKQNMDGE